LKNTQNLIKIPPEGADLFYADGRTDRRNEANNRIFTVLPKDLERLKWGQASIQRMEFEPMFAGFE